MTISPDNAFIAATALGTLSARIPGHYHYKARLIDDIQKPDGQEEVTAEKNINTVFKV